MAVPWQAILTVAVLAAVFTGVSVYRLARERWLRRGGVRTRAVVVGQRESFSAAGGSGDAGLVHAPVVEFTTRDGRTVRTSSPVSSNLPTAVPGRAMTVYYNPDNPEEVAIQGYGLGTYRLFLAIGLVLGAVAVALVVVPERVLLAAVPVFVPVALGTAFLGIGGFGIGRVWSLRLRGGRADGVVVGETRTSTREGMPMYHPVVRFRTSEGHEIETASERGRTLRRVRQGQAVGVRYHPDDPSRMVLAGDGARPLFSIFAFVGLLLLGGTTTVLLFILGR